MSDDAKDKPFEPSEHKLDEARKRGEVAQVRDLPSVGAMLLLTIVSWLMGRWIWGQLQRVFHVAMESIPQVDDPAILWRVALTTTIGTLWIILPMLLVVGVTGTLLHRLLVGPVFSFKPVTPDLKRLNPIEGFKRMFSSDTWFNVIKALLAATLVGSLVAVWTINQLPQVMRPSDPLTTLLLALRFLLGQALVASLLLGAIALFDTLYQHWSFRRKMRMDMKDLRDEYKQLEGSPEVKSARKSEHRRLNSG